MQLYGNCSDVNLETCSYSKYSDLSNNHAANFINLLNFFSLNNEKRSPQKGKSYLTLGIDVPYLVLVDIGYKSHHTHKITNKKDTHFERNKELFFSKITHESKEFHFVS